MEDLKYLLNELGKSIGLPDLAPDEDGYCCLSFDTIIKVHFQEECETGMLKLFCPLGEVDESHDDEVYEKLLEADMDWKDTGGGTLGVDVDNHIAILFYKVSIDGMQYQEFETILKQFVDYSELWINRLKEGFAYSDGQNKEGDLNIGFLKA